MNQKILSLPFVFCLIWLCGMICSSPIWACGDDLPESPLYFIENKGQWGNQIQYQLELNAGRLFLENDRLTYVLVQPEDLEALHPHGENTTLNDNNGVMDAHAFQILLEGANPNPMIDANCLVASYRNYFRGNDPSKWVSQVQQWREISYDNIYDGIDMRLYGENSHLKYDFIVAPDADLAQIALKYEWATSLSLHDGNLYIETSVNTMIEQAPYAYQYIDGQLQAVACQFVVDNNTVRFDFPEGYDESQELIIDPELVFSSYTGSSADNFGFTATYDDEGHLYAGGTTFDIGYPTTMGAYQITFEGGGTDMGISKFSPDGSNLIYSTYIGGSTGTEPPHSLIVNEQGELIILGTSSSTDYPTTSNAYDDSFAGGTTASFTGTGLSYTGGVDMVVTKLSADGSSLVGSTYLGGSENDGVNAAAALNYNYADQARGEVFLDEAGNILIASCTASSDFPANGTAFQSSSAGGQDACIAKFNPDLSDLLWATYLGGGGDDAVYSIQVEETGELLVCGGTTSAFDFPTTSGALNENALGGESDAFVTKLSADGETLLASTYLGTNDYDQSYFVDIDDAGAVYTFGQTEGNYAIEGDVYFNDNSGLFIHKLSSDLSTTSFSMTFGNGNGAPNISPTAFLVDNCNQIYISGWGGTVNGGVTGSTTNDLPITSDAFQSTTDGSDFYFAIFTENAQDLGYASFFGASSGGGEHVDGGTSRFDKDGNIYQAVCAGCGGSDAFPTTPGAWSNTNNANNCNLGAIKFAFEFTPVNANFVALNDLETCINSEVAFENTSNNATEFFWDFGDMETSDLENPNHIFPSEGVYEVTLIAFNPDSECSIADTTVQQVTVFGVPELQSVNDPICETDSLGNPTGNTFLTISVSGQEENFILEGDFVGSPLTVANESETTVLFGPVNATFFVMATGSTSGCVGTLNVLTPIPPQLTLVTPAFCDGVNTYTVEVNVTGINDTYNLDGSFLGSPSLGIVNNAITALSFSFDETNPFVTAEGTTGCIVTLPIAPPVFPELVLGESVCDSLNAGFFNVTASIANGAGVTHILEGAFEGGQVEVSGTETVALAFATNETSYTITAYVEGVFCEVNATVATPECCQPEAGMVSMDLQLICGSDSAVVVMQGGIIEEGQEVWYVLHSNPDDPEGSAVAINQTGVFFFPESGANFYETYSVTAVIAYADPSGNEPDWGNICTVLSNQAPVIFLAPLSFDIDEYCDFGTGDYFVMAAPQGGYPQYDPTASYQVFGDFTGELLYGETVNLVFDATTTTNTYSFSIANDSFDCHPILVNSEPFYCEKTAIELLRFTGQSQEAGNLIQWTTASEANNAYFTLQRSTDGISFENITLIEGSGTSTQQVDYQYFDPIIGCEINYYHLTWTDNNGQVDKSNIIAVQSNNVLGNSNLSVQPNPNKGIFTIQYSLPNVTINTKHQIQLFDAYGRLVWQEQGNSTIADCTQSHHLNLSDLGLGVYYIQVVQGNDYQVGEKVVIGF